MPRQTLDIKKFNYGLITELDRRDIPLEAGVDGTRNIDPNATGKLSGAYNPDTIFSDIGGDGVLSKWVEHDNSQKDLVMTTNNSVKIIEDYDGAASEVVFDVAGETLEILNKSVYIGCGKDSEAKWIGKTDKYLFGTNNRALQFYTGTGTIGSQNMYVDCENFTGAIPQLQPFYFKITTILGTNTFSYLGGTTSFWSNNIAITGGWQSLNSGVSVRFPDAGLYTLDDSWKVEVISNDRNFIDNAALKERSIVDYDDDWDLDVGIISDGGGTVGNFSANQLCHYAVSYAADNDEESELFLLTKQPYTISSTPEASLDIPITVLYKGWPQLSHRIQYITLWRSDNRGLYRYVDRVAIDDSGWSVKHTNTAYIYHTYTFNDDGGIGESYEAYTGISQEYSNRGVNYGVSCVINSTHIIGNCKTDSLEDASRVIYQSELNAFHTFNVNTNLMKLSFIPKALASFNGRVYAFDNNRFSRINPEGLYQEDYYEGVGCESQQGFVVTETGLFFANSNACYYYNGQNIVDLSSDLIKNKWQATDGVIRLTYDAYAKQILFFKDNICFAYHIDKKRWDYYDNAFTSNISGVFSDLDGYAIVSLTGSTSEFLKRYFGDTNKRQWVWQSNELTFDDESQIKKIYEIEVAGSYNEIKYSLDSSIPSTDISLLDKNKFKTFRFSVSGLANNEVQSISLIYRPMIGKR